MRTIGTLHPPKDKAPTFGTNPNRFRVYSLKTGEIRATTGSKYSAKVLAQALNARELEELGELVENPNTPPQWAYMRVRG